MKKITALIICIIMLANIACISVLASALTIDSVYPTGKTNYTVGDTVTIKGTCNSGIDIVVRLLDQNGQLVFTDALLAPNNSGSYEFTGFILPQTSATGSLSYNIIISETGTAAQRVTQTMLVNVPTTPIYNDHNSSSNTPLSVRWDQLPQTIVDNVADVKTTGDAEKKIGTITQNTDKNKQGDEETRNNIATVVEVMAGNINAKTVSHSSNNLLVLNDTTLTSADLTKLDKTMAVLQASLAKNKLELNRDLFREQILKVKFDLSKKATMRINKSLLKLLDKIDILTIVDANFRMSYQVKDLSSLLGNKEEILIDVEQPKVASTEKNTITKISVNFNTDKTNTVKVSFPNIKGDTTYMAVVDEKGNAIGGKYNPATGCIEAKLSASGIYKVISNEKNFEDIKTKGKDVQDAIKILASKGVISGTSTTEFSPDGSITRAEIAALILRVLSKLDPNTNGNFTDVKQSDWFYGTAGSAKGYGIIKGFEDNTFRPNIPILKEEIVAVAARTLRNEMKYKNPSNKNEILGFADKENIADWSTDDIALAIMANLVVKTTDNKFLPVSDMTRGDAALILKKLFDKIW